MLAAAFAQFVDPNPAPGNQFGASIVPLSTGNVVVTSPFDDFGGTDAGAVYLFNGATGSLISTLRGSHANDNVGSAEITEVGDGNFVVASPSWDSGAKADVGAVTWGSGTTGVNGIVSAANSLVGSTAGDQVGLWAWNVTVLSNGNYVVGSPNWDNGAKVDAGAATWGSGATGVTGLVGPANSLVGSTAEESMGEYQDVTPLTNGNYVVSSQRWSDGEFARMGAARWVDGTTGATGELSAANSLVGSKAGDAVGDRVTPLTNGNYVVSSPDWGNGEFTHVGAVTWGSGATGVVGVVSAVNSLVGSSAIDKVGDEGVTALTNGNYVVSSWDWDNGPATDAGAVTWGSGTAGVTGVVSPANSLVGSTAWDNVGRFSVTPLTNGNYVVASVFWDNGPLADAGAVTWGSGTTGVMGVISAANSLVGSKAGDSLGRTRGGVPAVTALTNGNYVVTSALWDNGATVNVGAATWGNGTTGTVGVVSAANSLIGSKANDEVGSRGVTALANGNYVVISPTWRNGELSNAGAVTWGSGTTGIVGFVDAANSLIGSAAQDKLGFRGVVALTNGNYVVGSPLWDNGDTVNAGAVTWGSGTTGVVGVASPANSLVGSKLNDQIGQVAGAYPSITSLTNGNYVVTSPHWDNGDVVNAGAITWGDGATGITGAVSAANSLVGSSAYDWLGSYHDYFSVTALTNGNYVVISRLWRHGALVGAGAATWGDGAAGTIGPINGHNSARGMRANTELQPIVVDDVNDTFFASFLAENGGIVRVGSQFDGFQAAPPVIGGFGENISYREDAPPRRITSTAMVRDPDSVHFGGGKLRVHFSAGGQASDRLAIHTIGTGPGQLNVQGSQVRIGTVVIGTFTGGVGTEPLVVSLTDKATTSRVQLLLRNITYDNASENPPTNVRTVRAIVSDDDGELSNAVVKQISVAALNDAPVLAPADGGTVGYVNDAAAIGLLADATVTDPDSGNFAGGRLLVQAISGSDSSNRLLIGGPFTLSGDDVQLSGVTIGTRNTGGGIGTTPLEITFNAHASRSIVEQLVRVIRFRTTDGTSTAQRVIEFSLTDGDGGLSNNATKTVNVS